MVIEGTARQLFQQAIVRVVLQGLVHQGNEFTIIEVIRLPLVVAIDLDTRYVKTLFLNAPTDRGVRPERQCLFLTPVISCRQQGAGIARSQKSRNSLNSTSAPLLGKAVSRQLFAAATVEQVPLLYETYG